MAEHRLYTSHFRAALEHADDSVVLVRTSIGKPKWIRPDVADAMPFIGSLAPFGCFQIEDDDEFRRCYRHRLHKATVARLEARFVELQQQHGGRPLILLCYEKNPADCHRSLFAEWWMEQTGEIVPEYRWDARPADPPPSTRAFTEDPAVKPLF